LWKGITIIFSWTVTEVTENFYGKLLTLSPFLFLICQQTDTANRKLILPTEKLIFLAGLSSRRSRIEGRGRCFPSTKIALILNNGKKLIMLGH